MADASSRTDTSTVVDTDDKNQRLENGQSGAIVMASNSSDRSDRSDKPMDQKVLILSPMPSLVFITILYDCL
jgi:transcription factor TGA